MYFRQRNNKNYTPHKIQFTMSPSLNYSYYQTNASYTLKNQKKFSVFTELSLQIEGKEYIPDVCVYPPMKINRNRDILRMTEMPLLAIEILSPTQGTKEIIDKFEVYFANGIKSCWLIEPATSTITVYNSLDKSKTFLEGEVIDTVLGLNIAISEIFDDNM